VAGGRVTHPAVAEAVGMEYVPPEEALAVGPHTPASADGAKAGARPTEQAAN
jgi:hypothetical protein